MIVDDDSDDNDEIEEIADIDDVDKISAVPLAGANSDMTISTSGIFAGGNIVAIDVPSGGISSTIDDALASEGGGASAICCEQREQQSCKTNEFHNDES